MPSSRYYRFKILDKKEKIKKIKVFASYFLILIVFLFLIWTIFLSSLFDIRYIAVSDSNYLTKDEVEETIFSIGTFSLGKNLLILSKYRLKEKLAAAFPAITNVTIRKKFLHTLTINFQKRIPLGIWCRPTGDQPQADNDNDCYFFDKEGIAFTKVPRTEGSLILKIEDKSKNNISLGDQILSGDQIGFMLALNNKINESEKLKILEFKIKPSPSIDLEAITDKNWSIYLDDKQDPAAAVGNLLIILREATKNSDNLRYIDLRIPSRIFYKLR